MNDSNRVFILGPGLNRFLPQLYEQILGPANVIGTKTNPDKPLKADQLPISSLPYCSGCEVTWPQGKAGMEAAISHPSHHTLSHLYAGTSRSLVVHTDGACSDNGKPDVAAGLGIYFGPDSKYNFSNSFKPVKAPTSQSAELKALVQAMKIVPQEVVPARSTLVQGDADRQGFRLILATDSSYAVECMCKYWKTWTVSADKHTLLNREGKVMANSDMLLAIETEVDKLSRVGVQVVYCHISRQYNREADRLVRAGKNLGRCN